MKLTEFLQAGLLAILPAILLTGCLPTAPADGKVEIKRLDLAVYGSDRMPTVKLDSLNRAFRPGIEALHRINASGGNVVPGYRLESLSTEATSVFTPDVEKRLPSLSPTEKRLEQIRQFLADKESPLDAIKFPSEVYAVVWPYSQSVVIADSIMLIALNHYLGSDYEGYASFEEYRRREKEASRIPFDVAEALVRTAFPYRSSKSTVASRMLYEGAVLTAVKQMTGEENDAAILSYSDAMMDWANGNEGRIWTTLVNRKLLFSTSMADASRLFNPSPATTAINPGAPGRMGRYIGLRMIESLMDVEPRTTLLQILSPTFYDSDTALQRTRYSPR